MSSDPPLGEVLPVLPSGWQRHGPQVRAFEDEFAAHVGARHAVAVQSGSTGMELCLRALRLPHGSRVLLSTLSPVGVVLAALRASLAPVLVDVDPESGGLDPERVADAARTAGRPAGALVVSHWGGLPADPAVLGEAAGLPPSAVVDDACEALGAAYLGRPVGSTGTACFSCAMATTRALGEGGVITTDDAQRAGVLRRVRDLGVSAAARRHVSRGHAGPHVLAEGGLPLGLTEQTAAEDRVMLRRVPEDLARRRELAGLYDARLAGLPGVGLPPRPDPSSGEHAWRAYRVHLDEPGRSRVLASLRRAGAPAAPDVAPLHHDEACREVCELPDRGFSAADRLAERLVSLPIDHRMASSVVDRVGVALEQVS